MGSAAGRAQASDVKLAHMWINEPNTRALADSCQWWHRYPKVTDQDLHEIFMKQESPTDCHLAGHPDLDYIYMAFMLMVVLRNTVQEAWGVVSIDTDWGAATSRQGSAQEAAHPP
jgi:hypothetical protein